MSNYRKPLNELDMRLACEAGKLQCTIKKHEDNTNAIWITGLDWDEVEAFISSDRHHPEEHKWVWRIKLD